MAMFVIAGTFTIQGAQPDGDSVRFTPDDPSQWDVITGINRVKRNASGAAQLRLDAIDALETHYGNPRTHQPLGLAHAAADELLTWLGFTNVVRGQSETVNESTPTAVTGHIFTRSADLYGRCIALVGRGDPPKASGSAIFVDGDVLTTTANHDLISKGLAYPTYYRALFPDLRQELTGAVKNARDDGLGVWPHDETTSGATVPDLDALQNTCVILPKLFRRLVDYLHLGDTSLAGFPAFLDQAGDRFFILSTGHSTTGLDAIVKVDGDVVQMTHPPEDLVFDEK
jgi:endonuclease YncB( thermonuclease family)